MFLKGGGHTHYYYNDVPLVCLFEVINKKTEEKYRLSRTRRGFAEQQLVRPYRPAVDNLTLKKDNKNF